MAEYKTAEQYVVDKLETVEKELEDAKVQHSMEVNKLMYRLNSVEAELAEAYDLLNMLRDFIVVRKDSYFGNCIYFDTVYGKEHPEIVARLMEYYDMRPEEDEDDE